MAENVFSGKDDEQIKKNYTYISSMNDGPIIKSHFSVKGLRKQRSLIAIPYFLFSK